MYLVNPGTKNSVWWKCYELCTLVWNYVCTKTHYFWHNIISKCYLLLSMTG